MVTNMPYLTRLILENFRKHECLDVDFSAGLNAIVGDNNSGKTTLMRALRFLAFADSVGKDRLIRHGAKHTRVQAEFSDGSCVSREVGEVHSVSFGKNGKMDETYVSPTSDVIEGKIRPRLADLGLGPMYGSARGMMPWPQFQSSGLKFLVHETPAGVNATLASYSFSDVFAAAEKISKRRLREEATTSARLTDQVRSLRDQLGAVRAVSEAVQPLQEQIHGYSEEIEGFEAQIAKVEPLLVEAQAVLGQKILEVGVIDGLAHKLSAAKAEFVSVIDEIDSLEEVLQEIVSAEKEVTYATKEEETARSEVESAQAAAFSGGVCPLCGSACSSKTRTRTEPGG